MRTAARVWDAPTRLFHWLLVALIAFSWWSAERREMDWHRVSGLVVLGLVVFRIVIWGLVGGSTARFGSFLRSPRKVITYLRSQAGGTGKVGHNPLGGYSVAAMLLILVVQVGVGLFATDTDGLESGPLSYLVSFDQSRVAAKLHHICFNLLLALIALHMLAILFYLVVRKRNLVWPMVTGADSGFDIRADELIPASRLKLAVAVLIASALAWWTSLGLRI